MDIGPKKLVREVNRKLARSKRAVFRNKKSPDSTPEAYILLDTKSGEGQYLSFEDLLSLAQKLGVLSS